MSKTFDSFQKATIKNAAKAVAHFQARKEKIDEQIAVLEKQKEALDAEIANYEKAVADITGGYTPLELCEKVSSGNGGQNDWVFKYPTTIVPVPVTSQEQTPTDSQEAQPETPEVPETSENPENNAQEEAQPGEADDNFSTQESSAEEPDPMNDIFA